MSANGWQAVVDVFGCSRSSDLDRGQSLWQNCLQHKCPEEMRKMSLKQNFMSNPTATKNAAPCQMGSGAQQNPQKLQYLRGIKSVQRGGWCIGAHSGSKQKHHTLWRLWLAWIILDSFGLV